MSLINLIKLNTLGDERGQLVVLEELRNIPFAIKRVYYLVGTRNNVARGFHAHHKLEQVAVCVSGKCRMILDDGQHREEVWLDAPDKAVCIGKMIWHEMHDFSDDCVLLVLADEYYQEADYVRDYGDFLRLTANAGNS